MHKTVKHSNEHTFVGMDENLYEVVLQVKPFLDLVQVQISHGFLFSFVQNTLRGCTKAFESSTQSKTCWLRNDPGRQMGPDTA